MGLESLQYEMTRSITTPCWLDAGSRKGTFHLVSLNPLTPKISLVIFLTVCHTIIVIFCGEFGIGSLYNPLFDIFPQSHHLSNWYCSAFHTNPPFPRTMTNLLTSISTCFTRVSFNGSIIFLFQISRASWKKKLQKEINLIQWVCQPWTCTNCI